MNELAEVLHGAFRVIAPEYSGHVAFLYPRWMSATGALIGNQALLFETAPVKVFLNMGDDHVPLADEYPAPRHEFQTFDKIKVMQAGS
jgi:hypothetical protein